MKSTLYALFFFLICAPTFGQGIRGVVKGNTGETLPFASIYIKQTGTGTSSNADGYYELRLNPGTYQITFQYLGFAALTKTIQVGSTFSIVDITLQPQSITLNEVTVTDEAEDPAYTIMRKAITKAKFHLLQADNYSATVYTKGTGKLTKIPWIARKALQEEGLDTNQAFTSESVSEIYFERPSTFKEKIISIRTSGEKDNSASPNAYINSSFYLPVVVDAISPLSPRAFAYYRFTYLGSFQERGYEVNKIQVTPRSRGENVFEGTIYIRENYYNIHSLYLKTTLQGFDLSIEQIYAPIVDDIWMPVTQKYLFEGSFMGFGVEYSYLASLSDYSVTANRELSPEITLIDEKIEEVPEEVENQEIKKEDVKEALQEDNKKLTRKQLEKMLDEYENQEEAESDDNFVSDTWYEVDTTARKKDSTYWAEVRPVPLTEDEIKGYKVADSTYVAVQADSTRRQDGGNFEFTDLLFGNTYGLGKRLRFDFDGFLPQLRYNTVEGFNLDFAGTFRWKEDSTLHLRINPNVRYGFSSGKVYGKLNATAWTGERGKENTFSVDGGKYIYQFHPNSIDPLINSLYTLLFARNYMKLYEQYFGTISYTKQLSHKYSVGVNAIYATRNELFNNTDWSLFRPGENWYSTNEPANEETKVGGFNNAKVFKTALEFKAKPWLKYRRHNGKIYPIANSSPEFRVTLNSGWANVLESTPDYQQIEVGFKTIVKLGVRATLDIDAEAGSFLTSSNLQFMDFKHFNGGLTEIAPLKVTGNYRLLDYYQYSTQKNYVSLFTHVRFRKFLFTHIPVVRISGVKENLFFNYLKTDSSPNYFEVGYTIDNIFRVLRLEFVQSFNEFTPNQFGVRIGVASIFGND